MDVVSFPGSRYSDLFNYHLQRMAEVGVMDNLHKRYTSSQFHSGVRRPVNEDCSSHDSPHSHELVHIANDEQIYLVCKK